MVKVRALAATGALGTGFREETLRQAIARRPDFLGCDAGSTDAGPFYLGSGQTMASPAAIRRDLLVMLREAVPAGIPVLIGSAGTGVVVPTWRGRSRSCAGSPAIWACGSVSR
jgi:hypothetical protein